MKKYKLTEESIKVNGVALYRIEALRDFAEVKAGDKGGFVQSEDNLSHDGKCWVYDSAKVFGNATAREFSTVRGFAVVSGFAFVSGSAVVRGDSVVRGSNIVKGGTVVRE